MIDVMMAQELRTRDNRKDDLVVKIVLALFFLIIIILIL